MARSKRETAMLIIAFTGILLSIYAITLHYAKSGSICDISDKINCDVVNKSEWSLLFGIPVAVLGLLAYLLLFFAILFRSRIQRWLSFTPQDFIQYLLLLVVAMFGFQLYLTFAEVFLIKAYCLVCLASQICTFLLLVLVLLDRFRPRISHQ